MSMPSTCVGGFQKGPCIDLQLYLIRETHRSPRHVQYAFSHIHLHLIQGSAQRSQSALLVMFWPKEGRKGQTSMRPIRSCEVDEQGKFLVKAERYRLPMTDYLRRPEQAQ